jgi:hypothetical protein
MSLSKEDHPNIPAGETSNGVWLEACMKITLSGTSSKSKTIRIAKWFAKHFPQCHPGESLDLKGADLANYQENLNVLLLDSTTRDYWQCASHFLNRFRDGFQFDKGTSFIIVMVMEHGKKKKSSHCVRRIRKCIKDAGAQELMDPLFLSVDDDLDREKISRWIDNLENALKSSRTFIVDGTFKISPTGDKVYQYFELSRKTLAFGHAHIFIGNVYHQCSNSGTCLRPQADEPEQVLIKVRLQCCCF